MFLYRDHRGMLHDSMKTVVKLNTRQDLVDRLQNDIDRFGVGKYDCSKITIEPFGFDKRIGWDSHIVCLDGWGVFGFTDRAP